MKKILIIVPDGGMLFESAGIADILMQANRLHPESARETGASPARYVAEARLAAARQRLEQTHETLDRIAEQTGFGSSINLRRLFEKQLNLTPGEYRQRFHCRKMA